RNLPKDFDAATRRTITEKYIRAIDTQVVPAYRRMRAFVHDEYLPRGRTTVGLSDLPGGDAMYAFAVRTGATTNMPHEEIFAPGQRELPRTPRKITRLESDPAAAGDAPLTRYKTENELLRAYTEFRRTVEAKLPSLFGRFPKAAFEIRAIEPFR